MMVDLPRLIAALRDTAEKATSTEKVEVPSTRRGQYGLEEAYTYTETHDRYPREWIAGRLLGMADTLEAMLGLADTVEPITPSQGREAGQ